MSRERRPIVDGRPTDVKKRMAVCVGTRVVPAAGFDFFDFTSVIHQHAEPNTLPSWKSTFCNSTRTRRALRHPSISRQTYRRDKVGPPNPQANHESCVSFPFRAEITRPELPDPPPSRPRHLALKSPSATRPERSQLSQVLDGTVEHRRATPR